MKRWVLCGLLAGSVACSAPTARRAGSGSTSTSTSAGAGGSTGAAGGQGAGSSGSTAGAASSGSTAASASGATSTGGAGSTGSTSGASSAGGSTGSACYPDNVYVAGDASLCCSGQVDAQGYCGTASAGTTGSASTTTGGGTSGSTGQVGTGTTTGGTCPANVPDMQTGQTQSSGPCTPGHETSSCPHGFTCQAGQCVLNGGSSPLQVTLSFDDAEDIDLHLREPLPDGGECEIYYGNPGPVPQPDGGFSFPFDAGFGWPPFGGDGGFFPTPTSCSVGWLDRDANAACNASAMDGVNIENIFYPSNQPAPSGTYKVYVNYWQDCDATPTSNFAVQVRLNGQVYEYCGQVNINQAYGGGQGAGFLVATFTVP